MLDLHSDALTSSNAAYHEFLLFYRSDLPLVYGFVEGKDDPTFYKGFIEHLLIQPWSIKLVVAGNKQKVLELLTSMDWVRFSSSRICFFVDRDLSDYIVAATKNFANLYVTDEYSIENSIVSVATLERTLEEILNIQGLIPDELDAIRREFEDGLQLFRQSMVAVMAQIIAWRRANTRLCLDDVELKEWFFFRQGRLCVRESFTDDRSRLSQLAIWLNATRSSGETIAQIITEVASRAHSVLRGKYLWWFFVQCALSIHESISHFCPKRVVRPKVRTALRMDNAVVLIAPRARAPASLRQFIEQTYGSYTQGFLG